MLGRRRVFLVSTHWLSRAVSERESRGVVDVLTAGGGMAAIRGKRPGSVVDDDVGAVAQHLRLDADRRDEPGMGAADAHVLHSRDRLGQRARQVLVRGRQLVYK